MHTYSTDSSEKRYIPFFIAAFAIVASFALSALLKKCNFEFPWWFSLPIDTMGLYGVFYFLFDRYVWRWTVLRKLYLTKVPDISGKWKGKVTPTPTNGASAGLAVPTDIDFTIHQTWAELLICGRTALSKSRSLSGNFIISDERSISYEYTNEPANDAPSTMHVHRGTAILTLSEDGKSLEGEYYSGRDRQNIGKIKLTREN
jgi:hypothetical protein